MSAKSKNPYLPEKILKDEHDEIRLRRAKVQVDLGNPEKDAIGLALSGGGIRSATFNLGLLQALQRCGLLKHIDYLSTVSGGGYIGSSLAWFLKNGNGEFPYGTKRSDYEKRGDVLSWLRDHGSYITPGNGLNMWSLVAAVLTGTGINLLILIPMFLLFIQLTASISLWPVPFYPLLSETDPVRSSLFAWIYSLGLLLLTIFVAVMILYGILSATNFGRNVLFQRKMRCGMGRTLMFAIFFLVVGSLPAVYHYLNLLLDSEKFTSLLEWAMSGVSVTGIISFLAGMRGRKRGNETQGLRSFLLSLGLSLLIYGLFLWGYHLVAHNYVMPWLYWALALSIVLAVFANVNHVSMHRYYRNRLMEAYLPHELLNLPLKDSDQALLKDMKNSHAPYQILNTNIQLLGSSVSKWSERGGDNFIFSACYCGSVSTDYVKTEEYVGKQSNLATSLAISGAAVDPNTYATRSRPLSFLMTLLNVRLGYWIRNPKHPARILRGLSRPWWYWYMFAELFGGGLNEKRPHVHLSDGGHFENLGAYELIRRRCKYIIIADAAADDEWTFGDLAKLIEMVRIDFGAQVHLNVDPLKPQGTERRSERAFVRGHIEYPDTQEQSQLIYVKTTLIDGLPEDIYAYHRVNPSFPDQTTADQFFDEPQFEAYRELGYHIGRNLCPDEEWGGFKA